MSHGIGAENDRRVGAMVQQNQGRPMSTGPMPCPSDQLQIRQTCTEIKSVRRDQANVFQNIRSDAMSPEDLKAVAMMVCRGETTGSIQEQERLISEWNSRMQTHGSVQQRPFNSGIHQQVSNATSNGSVFQTQPLYPQPTGMTPQWSNGYYPQTGQANYHTSAAAMMHSGRIGYQANAMYPLSDGMNHQPSSFFYAPMTSDMPVPIYETLPVNPFYAQRVTAMSADGPKSSQKKIMKKVPTSSSINSEASSRMSGTQSIVNTRVDAQDNTEYVTSVLHYEKDASRRTAISRILEHNRAAGRTISSPPVFQVLTAARDDLDEWLDPALSRDVHKATLLAQMPPPSDRTVQIIPLLSPRYASLLAGVAIVLHNVGFQEDVRGQALHLLFVACNFEERMADVLSDAIARLRLRDGLLLYTFAAHMLIASQIWPADVRADGLMPLHRDDLLFLSMHEYYSEWIFAVNGASFVTLWKQMLAVRASWAPDATVHPELAALWSAGEKLARRYLPEGVRDASSGIFSAYHGSGTTDTNEAVYSAQLGESSTSGGSDAKDERPTAFAHRLAVFRDILYWTSTSPRLSAAELNTSQGYKWLKNVRDTGVFRRYAHALAMNAALRDTRMPLAGIITLPVFRRFVVASNALQPLRSTNRAKQFILSQETSAEFVRRAPNGNRQATSDVALLNSRSAEGVLEMSRRLRMFRVLVRHPPAAIAGAAPKPARHASASVVSIFRGEDAKNRSRQAAFARQAPSVAARIGLGIDVVYLAMCIAYDDIWERRAHASTFFAPTVEAHKLISDLLTLSDDTENWDTPGRDLLANVVLALHPTMTLTFDDVLHVVLAAYTLVRPLFERSATVLPAYAGIAESIQYAAAVLDKNAFRPLESTQLTECPIAESAAGLFAIAYAQIKLHTLGAGMTERPLPVGVSGNDLIQILMLKTIVPRGANAFVLAASDSKGKVSLPLAIAAISATTSYRELADYDTQTELPIIIAGAVLPWPCELYASEILEVVSRLGFSSSVLERLSTEIIKLAPPANMHAGHAPALNEQRLSRDEAITCLVAAINGNSIGSRKSL